MDNCPNLPATLVEEGAKRLFPSSFEFSFPATIALQAIHVDVYTYIRLNHIFLFK